MYDRGCVVNCGLELQTKSTLPFTGITWLWLGSGSGSELGFRIRVRVRVRVSVRVRVRARAANEGQSPKTNVAADEDAADGAESDV